LIAFVTTGPHPEIDSLAYSINGAEGPCGTDRHVRHIESEADDLRDRESAKIECGRADFKALSVGENPARYGKFKDVAGLLNHVAEVDEAVKAIKVWND
jgi:hypothetical protein